MLTQKNRVLLTDVTKKENYRVIRPEIKNTFICASCKETGKKILQISEQSTTISTDRLRLS